jgi:hypothetical protein
MSTTINPENPIFYTYLILDPRYKGTFVYDDGKLISDYLPIYGGKGYDDRCNDHLRDAINSIKKSDKLNLLRKILEEGFEPKIFKVLENVTEKEAFAKERYVIRVIGRLDKGLGTLLNKTDGGEGWGGFIRTREHKRKISEANKGQDSDKLWYNDGKNERRYKEDKQPEDWVLGRLKFSDKHIKSLSKISKNKIWYNDGKNLTRCLIGEQPIGWVEGPLPMKRETKEKLSKIFKNVPNLFRKGRRYYNDGELERFYLENQQPDGWVLGRLSKGRKHHCYKKSPKNKGKRCYNNGSINKCFLEDKQPEDWVLGMLRKL